MHDLARLFADAVDGVFPPVDGEVEVMVTDRPGHCGVIEFTGHSVVLVDDPDVDRVHAEIVALGANGFGGANHPRVLQHLAGATGHIGTLDAVMVATGRGATPSSVGLTRRDDLADHPRVARSLRYRDDVTVLGDDAGVVTLGRGVAGRLELAVELFGDDTLDDNSQHDPDDRDGRITIQHGRGHGRRLIDAALAIAPVGPVWAQVSPGNAASLRAFLACGFTPIGSETLILHDA